MNWLLAKQIRSRLTVWYIAVLASILGFYVVLVFAFQYQFIRNQIYHDEVQDVVTVEGLLFFDQKGALQLQQNYFSHPQSHLLIDRLMEVRDQSGVVLYRTPNLNGASLGGPSLPNEGDDSFNQRVIDLLDGTSVLLISHLHTMQGRVLLIRLGYSLAPFHQRMRQFLEILLVAFPVALVIAGFAGFQIAKRALEPIQEMADRAQRITARNLNARLAIENPDDELGHMAGVFNDLLNRLEEAFQQLNSFTADASHELRAPLAAIRTVGEIALRDNDATSSTEAIASILEESHRLDETIAGLLLLARAETVQPIGPNTFSLVEVVSDVVSVLEVLGEERGIEINTVTSPTSGLVVSGDRSLIRSAVMNVIHNAIKFSPSNSVVTIAHSVATVEQDGFVELSVTDQGQGIPVGEMDRVFDRFYTSTKREASLHHGAGLGLSIAKLVIQRSGGEIFFDPSTTFGARCVIHLPAHRLMSEEEGVSRDI